MEKVDKELHELLRRWNKERRGRRERRRRNKAKAAAAERYRQKAEEREAADGSGITTYSIGPEENGDTAATHGVGREASTVSRRQRNKQSSTLDTQKKLEEFIRNSPYAYPPFPKPQWKHTRTHTP